MTSRSVRGRSFAPLLLPLAAGACLSGGLDPALLPAGSRRLERLGLGSVPPAPAAEARRYDARALYGRALTHNRRLRTRYEAWRAAAAAAGAEGYWPEPKAFAGVFFEPVETRVGPQRLNLKLSQAVPLSGRVGAAKRRALRLAEAAWQAYREAALEVVRDLRLAAVDLAFLQRSLTIERENLHLLRGWLAVLEARYRVDRGAHADLVRLQVEIGKLEDRISALEELEPVRRARLNELLDRPPDAALELAYDPLAEFTGRPRPKLDPKALLAQIRAAHPKLAELAARERAAVEGFELARASRLPDLEVGLRYIVTGEARNPATPGSGDDPIAVELGMRLPIQGGRYAALERAAERRRRAVRERFLDEQNRLATALKEALFQLSDGLRRIDLYAGSLLPKARESVEVNLAGFRANRVSFLDLLDAQRLLLHFQLALAEARADAARGAARLYALTGGRSFRPAPLARPAKDAEGTQDQEKSK